MPKVHLGRKDEPAIELKQSANLIAVRTRSKRNLSRSMGAVSAPPPADIADATLVIDYPEAGVAVYRVPEGVATQNRAVCSRVLGTRIIGASVV